mmetsp:Transcript_7976/g.16631  ORF Transcript_7976/g.16631 Transcript_7976/m.16631 type:complete len:166 (+) Transcript_7976:407-904(+)
MSFLLTTWSISELRGDVAELKGDVAELKRNVGEMDKKLDAVIEAQTKTDQALETLITKVTNIETANQRLPTAPDEKVEKAKQRMSNELISKGTKLYANGADGADLLCADEIAMQLKDETSSLYMSLDANFDENGNARMNADKLWVAFMRMTAKSIAKRKGGRSDP